MFFHYDVKKTLMTALLQYPRFYQPESLSPIFFQPVAILLLIQSQCSGTSYLCAEILDTNDNHRKA